eukprot:3422278-Prorocentrum_lima.AAC.1
MQHPRGGGWCAARRGMLGGQRWWKEGSVPDDAHTVWVSSHGDAAHKPCIATLHPEVAGRVEMCLFGLTVVVLQSHFP